MVRGRGLRLQPRWCATSLDTPAACPYICGHARVVRPGGQGIYLMSDNLVLELLRAIRGDIADLKTDVLELKERVGGLEVAHGSTATASASISRRLDRVGADVDLIKRRLDLVGAT